MRRLVWAGACSALVACNAIFLPDLSYDAAASGGASSSSANSGGAASSTSSASVSSSASSSAASGGAGGAGGIGGDGGQGGKASGVGGGPFMTGAGGGPVLTDPFCDQRFGALNAYELCYAGPAECKFFRSIQPSQNCNTTCGLAGVSCTGAFDQGANHCDEATVENCTAVLNDFICVCSKACGANAACPNGDVCLGGMCNAL